ncbi:MAG TPA: hypothetical protein PKC43_00250 [Phycisphaerales bacterium]|nr:hypothetical protein [Phycisphaerales bacterium]HMP35855.1 hypothetical protein [Phycisphaerales bacterium]
MSRLLIATLGSLAAGVLVGTAAPQGHIPQPGQTPIMPPTVQPEPGVPAPWTDPWFHSFCLPLGSCSELGSNPCVPDGGCRANEDASGAALVATWCEGSGLIMQCGGGWSLFADCEETTADAYTCGKQWMAKCLPNGTLGDPSPTRMTCDRPSCRRQ